MQPKTYPLKTPRTKLSMKKDPITMSGMKNTQLKALPRASFVCNKILSCVRIVATGEWWRHTQYIIGVQPSMVTHWNVVSMASPMLSKEVIPAKVNVSYVCKNLKNLIHILFAISAIFVCNVIRMAGNDQVVCVLLLPLLGPSHFSRHIDSFRLTQCCD